MKSKFYYVIEHETGIVRAAQSTFREATHYTTLENCQHRFIFGPVTADELHRFFPYTNRAIMG